MDNNNEVTIKGKHGGLITFQPLPEETINQVLSQASPQGRLILYWASRGEKKPQIAKRLGIASTYLSKFFRNKDFNLCYLTLVNNPVGLSIQSISAIAKAEAVLHMNTLSSLALSEATTSGEKQVKLSATKECLVLAGVYSQFEASPISIGNMLVQLTQTSNTYLPAGIEPIENRSKVVDAQ